ncbi:MAG: exo-alpha-sialidase [Candidatus Omnitrophica bacterium]|nr:exo-alpha-sialidase [Candidatus Omnitrophota bacterium]
MNTLQIVDQGVVFEGKEGTDCQSATFPGVVVLSNGTWMCTFRAAPRKSELAGQRVLLTRSTNNGRTWSEPMGCFSPPRLRQQPGTFRTGYLTECGEDVLIAVLCWVDQSNPSLPFFNEDTEGLLETRIFLSRSSDGGASWSNPDLIETPPWTCPTPITGPILNFGNGTLGCQFELNKGYDDPVPWSHKSVIQISSDRGLYWPETRIVSADPEDRVFFWDQRPSVFESGRILDLFWTFDRDSGTYLSIHACESLDYGVTWSAMWDTGVSGQPAPAVELSNGILAMAYMERTGVPTLKVRMSSDRGRTWPAESEVILFTSSESPLGSKAKDMNEAWSEMSAFSMGLPATAKVSNNEFVTVFYAGPQTDCTGIRWIKCKLD